MYLFPYYWLNCLYHGHILNTLDEKVFHRQVSALIGGHWVGPRTATALAAHFRSSKGTHGHILNAHAYFIFLKPINSLDGVNVSSRATATALAAHSHQHFLKVISDCIKLARCRLYKVEKTNSCFTNDEFLSVPRP